MQSLPIMLGSICNLKAISAPNEAFQIFISWRVWPDLCKALKSNFNQQFLLQAEYQAGNLIRRRFLVGVPIPDGRKCHKKGAALSQPNPEASEPCRTEQWNTGKVFLGFLLNMTRSLCGPSASATTTWWEIAISQQLRLISHSEKEISLCWADPVLPKSVVGEGSTQLPSSQQWQKETPNANRAQLTLLLVVKRGSTAAISEPDVVPLAAEQG